MIKVGGCHWLLHYTTHLVAPLQVLHFVGKFLCLAMTLMLKLLHPPLDLLIQLLQLLYVVFKFFQQPVTEERMVHPSLTAGKKNIQECSYSGGVIGYQKVKSVPLTSQLQL